MTEISMLTLNTASTALVIIDLQEGILPFAGGPHSADEVVARSARLAEHFRAKGAPVVMVRVGWSKDFAEALRQPVDAPTPAQALPPEWWHYPVALGKRDSELQLRRRGIDTVVLCGISTNIGVESTARNAWELGFSLVLAEDACSAASASQHQNSFTHIFPRIARVRSVEEIIAAL